jgi:ParB-like chromosome segregation protein Spo0J
MSTVDLPLVSLHPHPHNANIMPAPALKKLAAHLQRTGRYPPLIVRPLPLTDPADLTPQYQILDGHHRAKALAQLGHDTARCMVWDVDDDEALLLLATLNRLRGRDDPRKRADLVDQIVRRCGGVEKLTLERLARALPEDARDLYRLLELREAPAPTAPMTLDAMPVAVHFFLLPDQRRRLEARLRELGGSREEALMLLVAR